MKPYLIAIILMLGCKNRHDKIPPRQATINKLQAGDTGYIYGQWHIDSIHDVVITGGSGNVTSGGTAYCMDDIPQIISLHKTIDSLQHIIQAFKTLSPAGRCLEIKYDFKDSSVTISTCGGAYGEAPTRFIYDSNYLQ